MFRKDRVYRLKGGFSAVIRRRRGARALAEVYYGHKPYCATWVTIVEAEGKEYAMFFSVPGKPLARGGKAKA